MIRVATLDDCGEIESLIENSTRALSKDDYSTEQIEGALKKAMGLDTQLIEDKTYYVIEQKGELIAAGGWSYRQTLFGNNSEESRDSTVIDPKTGAAKIRAFFVHPDQARKGHGKGILTTCENAARKAGYSRLELMATLPGVRLYEKFGYRAKDSVLYPLSDSLNIEFVPMWKKIDLV